MKDLLAFLEEKFEQVREPVIPLYPYDKQTNKISLPPKIEKKLKRLVLKGEKVEAVKQVTQLTGAGLRVSKDYVDSLAENKRQKSRR
jgi:ribosomal protein L7/L12